VPLQGWRFLFPDYLDGLTDCGSSAGGDLRPARSSGRTLVERYTEGEGAQASFLGGPCAPRTSLDRPDTRGAR
jgi:hypothetical protein